MNDTATKSSPLKGGAPPTSEGSRDSASPAGNSGVPPPPTTPSSGSTAAPGAPPAQGAQPAKKTLGDHIDSLITRDLNATHSSHPPPPHSAGYQRSLAYPYHIAPPASGVAVAPGAQSVEELSNWKLRRAMQQKDEMERERAERASDKGRSTPTGPAATASSAGSGGSANQVDERQIIRIAQVSSPRKGHVEPVSPPDSASATASPATTTSAHPWRPTTVLTVSDAGTVSSASVAASVAADPMGFLQQRRFFPDTRQLSPLDYVKNRIVEVMRTSEDDKVSESRKEDGEAAPASAPASGAPPTSASPASKEGRSASGSPGEMVIDEGRPSDDKQTASATVTGTSPSQPPPPPHTQSPHVPTNTYTYPISVLTLQAGAQPPTKPPALLPHKEREHVAEPKLVNEPKPLLSAQYEALSDED